MAIEEWEACRRAVVCVIGPHAGEGMKEIFDRKRGDIERCGHTIWVCLSSQISRGGVLSLCGDGEGVDERNDVWFLMISSSSKGDAKDTKVADAATEMSQDGGVTWSKMPDGMSPVTGNLAKRKKKGTPAFVFDRFITYEDEDGVSKQEIDLWDFAQYHWKEGEIEEEGEGKGEVEGKAMPLKIHLGGSTLLAKRCDTSMLDGRILSHKRRVIAAARLAHPFCVMIR